MNKTKTIAAMVVLAATHVAFAALTWNLSSTSKATVPPAGLTDLRFPLPRDAAPKVFANYHAAHEVRRELLASRLARKVFVRCAKVLVRRRAAE